METLYGEERSEFIKALIEKSLEKHYHASDEFDKLLIWVRFYESDKPDIIEGIGDDDDTLLSLVEERVKREDLRMPKVKSALKTAAARLLQRHQGDVEAAAQMFG